jgi:3-oxoacyl-[acyl-carrier-protein] synthase-3
MYQAVIRAISYWLPEHRLTNEDIVNKHPEWTVEKISAKTGIYERRIAEKNTFVSDLACNAAKKLFEEYNINKSDIDFLLICTQSPDYFLPTTACIVQDRLGLSKNAGALDFNLGCSGYIYGLGLAKGLIASNSAKNILLITAETYSKFIHPDDKSNMTLFGDGAAATLISNNGEGLLINELVYGTDGSGAENLIVKNGGIKNRFVKGHDIKNETGEYVANDDFLYMNGGEIFKFTSENVPKLVDNILKKNNLEIGNINLFIFHQANKFMLDYIRKKIGIDEDAFFYFLDKSANTVSSTIPIALIEALNQNKIKNEDEVLLAGFGVGYSWGGCTLTKKNYANK